MKLRVFQAIFAMSLILSLAVGTVPIAAQSSGVNARVLPDTLMMRDAPSEAATILAELPRNTVFNAVSWENIIGNGGVWVYGSPAGSTDMGWVLSTFLEFPIGFVYNDLPVVNPDGDLPIVPPTGADDDTTTTSTADGTTGVTRTGINFRSGPSTEYSVYQVVAANTPVTILGQNSAGTWLNVVVGDQEGWMFAALVSTGNPAGSGAPDGGAATAPPAASGGRNYYELNLYTNPEFAGSNDYDGRIDPYYYNTYAIIYCFDGSGNVNSGSMQGGGVTIYWIEPGQEGYIFVATEAQINAVGVPAAQTIIHSESGFTLSRLSDGRFDMTGTQIDGGFFVFRWWGCQPNPIAHNQY